MPKPRKEGCLSRCLRLVCCCYCCCKVTRCCLRFWCCAAPQEELDEEEAVIAEDRGLTGKGALSTALRGASPAPPQAAGASKWKSLKAPCREAKPAAESPGFIAKLFGSPSSSTSALKIKSMPKDDGEEEEWQSMTNTIITRRVPSASAAALPPSPREEEDKVVKSPVLSEEVGTGGPILTLKDLGKFRGRVFEGAGSPSGTPPVPVLPTPGQSQFVSHRDNLKQLESRRIQKEKRDEKKGTSNTYLSKVKASSATQF